MAGSGPLEAELKRQASDLGLGDAVRWTGFLDNAEAMRELHLCLALVLPSISETWGLVVNEAMALNRPVIASAQVGACDLLLRHEVTGLIIPHPATATTIAAAMQHLACDEDRWHAMCAAARERAWLGDVERFADTVDLLIDPEAQPAGRYRQRLLEAFA